MALTLLALSTACSPTQPEPVINPRPAAMSDPTDTTFSGGAASPSPTGPSPARTEAPSPEPTAEMCRENGLIEAGTVDDPSMPRPFPYRIYLPPCYEDHAIPYYPTLYLLHGLAGDDSQWPSLGLVDTVEELILLKEIPPFLIVMPWQRTGLELEPAVTQVLLPHVEARYRARPGRRWRAIGGLSRGAGWAFRIAFKHSQLFSGLGLHSPAIFAGDLFAVERWLREQPNGPTPKVWIDIGDRDGLVSATDDLVVRLDELGIEYEVHRGRGWHDADYWSSQMDVYLRWYGSHWRDFVPDSR